MHLVHVVEEPFAGGVGDVCPRRPGNMRSTGCRRPVAISDGRRASGPPSSARQHRNQTRLGLRRNPLRAAKAMGTDQIVMGTHGRAPVPPDVGQRRRARDSRSTLSSSCCPHSGGTERGCCGVQRRLTSQSLTGATVPLQEWCSRSWLVSCRSVSTSAGFAARSGIAPRFGTSSSPD